MNKYVRSIPFKRWKGELDRKIKALPEGKRAAFLEKESETLMVAERNAFQSLNERALSGRGLTKGWRRVSHDYIQAQAKGIVVRKASRAGQTPSQDEVQAYFAKVFPRKKP